MSLIQTFETTISDQSGTLSAACIVVPKSAMSINEADWHIDVLREKLSLENLLDISPPFLAHSVAALLFSAQQAKNAYEVYKRALATSPEDLKERFGEGLFSFVEQVCFLDLLPIEESPLYLTSLGALFAKASGVGAGAFAGYHVQGRQLISQTVSRSLIA